MRLCMFLTAKNVSTNRFRLTAREKINLPRAKELFPADPVVSCLERQISCGRMAKKQTLVLLGFEDEPIAEKDRPYLSYTTNKIGGHADWPAGAIEVQPCIFCGQQRPLIVQIYAPLDDSQFHRTLYVFACLNAPCSTQSQAWTCVRIQSLEKSSPGADGITETRSGKVLSKDTTISWCSGADDWDEDGQEDMEVREDFSTSTFMRVDTSSVAAEQLLNEENGNVIQYEKVSDEDDESNSMEAEPIPGFDKLRVDETNANARGDGRASGATGGAELIDNLYTTRASAEIEGLEAEVVVVDTPVSPKRDLIALLKQPQVVPRSIGDVTLRGLYISVDEERYIAPLASDHVRELLAEYQRHEEVKTSLESPLENVASGTKQQSNANHDQELYEKGIPMHGDLMFHSFLSKLQENPGQLLRYSRNALPLLIAPIKEMAIPPHCQYCKNEMICEIQLLPTMIEKLRFDMNGERVPIDFGNVLVWTCGKSCWDTPDKMRQELVLVQNEA
ncbi:programmed cell death protein 2-like [Anopheles funestus]|uniref:programmed cell death protein 2-like n=1 Tax=Anopheles funestus TaxID=62324 RepID=UPI0020C6B3D3|nr:programmed cell death protein 2-like [Anopheles funestus]